jgi:hypothetical protein
VTANTLDPLFPILVERMNHTESLLISSVFGFLLTTTVSIAAAAYYIMREGKNQSGISKSVRRPFFLGVSALLMLLSGYYYFVLTHFYAAASTVIEQATTAPALPVDKLWSFFSLPLPWVGETANGVLYLALAPLFPMMLSVICLGGVWVLLKKDSGLSRWHLAGGLAVQLVPLVLMAARPLYRFLDTIY